jgi:hypothetical protein
VREGGREGRRECGGRGVGGDVRLFCYSTGVSSKCDAVIKINDSV